MDHVAIMKKSWGLVPKILDGRKKIESRWSKFKIAPFGKVKKGDRVYFKNAGESVSASAIVSKVIMFDSLTPIKVKAILEKYGGEGGIGLNNLKESYNWAKHKKYCTLVFLKNAKSVRPFSVNKAGFGTGAAWLTATNIKNIKI